MLGKDQPVILQLLEIPDEGPGRAQGRDDGTGGLRLPAAGRHGRARRPEGRLQGHRLRAAGRCRPRGPGMERADLLPPTRRSSPPGQGAERRRQPQREGAGGRQPGQHQRLHRDEERAGPAAKNFTAMLRLDHNRAPARSPPRTGKPWSATSRSSPCGATTRRPCTPTTASPPVGGKSA